MNENERIAELRDEIGKLEQECRSYCKERKCVECRYFFSRMDCQNEFIARGLTAKGYRRIERGEWIPVEKHRVESPKTECSLCGRDAVYQKVDGKWEFENFCPHCGADMRGEKE